MPKQLALFFCLAFIFWLFARDRKIRPMTSGALWVVLFWVIIIGTKPVSLWLGARLEMENLYDYMEGSPIDRYAFLVLMAVGSIILMRRQINWRSILASNRWLFAFIFYCAISTIWSDYTFLAFKRWVKDFGNFIMVFIILTETNITDAIKAVFSRYAYVAIPLSIVFNKWFPEYGKYYNPWDGQLGYAGVTTNKNELGIVLTICGLYLVWELFEPGTANDRKTYKIDSLGRMMLFMMMFWLLFTSKSGTAIFCFILGSGVLLLLRLPSTRKLIKHLGAYIFALCLLILPIYSIFLEKFVGIFSRDLTLTGRTGLWEDVLSVRINPLIGAGYKSFWIGSKVSFMWEKYWFKPNQAHNGYLEIYLNSGLIGLFLLFAIIVSTGIKLKAEVMSGSSIGIFLYSFFAVALFYNITEAMFGGITLIWFLMILASLYNSNVMISKHEISYRYI